MFDSTQSHSILYRFCLFSAALKRVPQLPRGESTQLRKTGFFFLFSTAWHCSGLPHPTGHRRQPRGPDPHHGRPQGAVLRLRRRAHRRAGAAHPV